VARDVSWGKVSVAGARDDYGVILERHGPDVIVDAEASSRLRDEQRAARTERVAVQGDPFFDRGPGYRRLSGGTTHADVDLLT
jgi:N-methylhydantoinase B